MTAAGLDTPATSSSETVLIGRHMATTPCGAVVSDRDRTSSTSRTDPPLSPTMRTIEAMSSRLVSRRSTMRVSTRPAAAAAATACTPSTLSPKPARPIRRVLHHDAGVAELVTDSVGRGEVLGRPGDGTRIDQTGHK